MAAADATTTPATVAVRALCEFAARSGDLDWRFTPSPTSQQGIAGHALVASQRGPTYRREVALESRWRDGALVVRGRADGWDADARRVEEIKTCRGGAARIPDNQRELHRAQARVYGWLLCEREGLAAIEVAVVYHDIDTQRETVFAESMTADALREQFDALCTTWLAWAEQEAAHRTARDAALAALVFPQTEWRSGQRELAAAVWRAARQGNALLAQAPTGIGKTLGTLFPLLKACPAERLDRIVFLTAKTPGRALALDAAETLARSSGGELPLRVVELVARDTACEFPGRACHGDACPLARGFWDRLPAARAAAVAQAVDGALLRRAALRDIALAHEVCPYHLGQEMARWGDVLVGDYNHWFDEGALLHALAQADGWRTGVLVDEAHNLVERARAMYSAELRRADFAGLRKALPPALARPLQRLLRAWAAAVKDQTEPHAVLEDGVPTRFAAALRDWNAAVGEQLAQEPERIDATLLEAHFAALRFARLAESFGAHSLCDVTLEPSSGRRSRASSTLGLRNVLPAPFLEPRFATARVSVLFSATLTPQQHYIDTLGLPEATPSIDVAGPYRGQLAVRIARHISTRWRDRERSLAPIAALIAAQYAARPGNYLAFFSSFDYLAQAAREFEARHPGVPVWLQQPGMDEAEREHFLARFHERGAGIGFAVLGGAFAEGIDLPGERLVGAFIATLGMPQVNPLNEAFRRRIDDSGRDGWDALYLVPGLRKVVQAAGRVVRTPTDRGTVHLIDDRYAQPRVRRLLPAWWAVE
jgi:DNA excision repair protein ERCC-2